MKKMVTLICFAVTMLICLPAWAQAVSAWADVISVDVSCVDFRSASDVSRQIEVKTGNVVAVTLCNISTTGYNWTEYAAVSDPTIISQTGHEIIPPARVPDEQPLVGSPGRESWTFVAKDSGKTRISMENRRPWNPSEGGWNFTLDVVVTAGK